jgi:RNA 2',3'-cyclic 3'-phosphodiesterase
LKTGTPAKLRVFAAFELPAEWQTGLEEVIRRLKAALPRGGVRWVRAEGIHLTLKFFGEVGVSQVPALQVALTQATHGLPPVALEADRLGVFPNPLRPRVVWMGVAGEVEKLGRLQKAIEAGLTPLGFPPEARGFTPHLTLGRVTESLQSRDRQTLTETLPRLSLGPFPSWTATNLSLVRSELRPSGAVYTRLAEIPLGSRIE